MKEWQDLGKELKRYTNADTFPVSITFLKDRKEIPGKTWGQVLHFNIRIEIGDQVLNHQVLIIDDNA